jgi:serine/threonine-protein kinase HipA
MFNGKTPKLNFVKKDFFAIQSEYVNHFSISGVQAKISLKLRGNELVVTETDGEYLLKPTPLNMDFNFRNEVPANEHLTMQIAKQVFRMKVAENALIKFTDGELAYITKRFDRVKKDKLRQEDFCQLSNRSPETKGKNFKYDGSYEEVGEIVYKYCSASKIEIEKLYKQIIFCYIFGNGDAHFKNFSLLESLNNDFLLSPVYDVLNTALHLPIGHRMALDMFKVFESESFKVNGFYGYEDFLKLAELYRIKENRAEKIIIEFIEKREKVVEFVKSSFLNDKAKRQYLEIFEDRLKTIKKIGT